MKQIKLYNITIPESRIFESKNKGDNFVLCNAELSLLFTEYVLFAILDFSELFVSLFSTGFTYFLIGNKILGSLKIKSLCKSNRMAVCRLRSQ